MSKGFTLLELIFTITLLGILFGLCVPFGMSLYNKNNLIIVEDDIIAAINYARNMALLRKERLSLTPLLSSDDWSYGMLLFVDNKTHKYSGARLLRQWRWSNRHVTVTWHGFQANNYILFANHLQHATTNGHFILSTNTGGSVKLLVNRFGRVHKQMVKYD